MDEIIAVMTEQEAIAWENRVKNTTNELRLLLADGYEREVWRALGYSSWSECIRVLKDKYELSERHLWQLHSANENEKLLNPGSVGQIPEKHLRPLSRLDSNEDKQEVWKLANDTAPNGKLTSSHVENTVNQFLIPKEQKEQVEKARSYITLAEWQQGKRWQGELSQGQMNAVNEHIEWAAFSWNPVTGCLHNCNYCYARDIANRFFEQKFEPAFIPERLSHPANTKVPKPRWQDDTRYKNVFTCSMADLFGNWVPQEWIEQVLKSIADNPQWTFLLLTKFPVKMAEFEYPPNVWLGTTVDYQWRVERAEKAFTKIKATGFNGVCWLSCEPMMEELTFSSLEMFDWVVMGGSSKSTQTPEYKPPFENIIHLHNQARGANCKIYQKTNLIPGMDDTQRIREFPE